jgi:hypothetical protein
MAEKRDYIMARLSAARYYAQSVVEGIDTCIENFIDADEDGEGDIRREAMDIILDLAGEVSRTVELAQAMFDNLGADEISECEEEDGEEDEG